MIDYIISDRAAWEEVNRLVVEDEVESDHQSVTVWLGNEVVKRETKEKKWREVVDWSEEEGLKKRLKSWR